MIIKLYKTNSERVRADKALTNELTITGELKGTELDILHPEIMLEYNNNYNGYNYAYIPEFSRYYFIDSITVVNHFTNIVFKHDALTNWKTQVRSSIAHITRTDKSKGSLYLKDDRIASTAEHSYQTRKLGNGFTRANNYVIITACGRDAD